jgi:hypothetical protein
VVGKVVDAATGAPVPGATVTLTLNSDTSNIQSTTTDAQGNFEFFNVLGGEYTLAATFNGYQAFSLPLHLTGASGQFTVPTVQLLFDYCNATPSCSGHGHCAAGGFCVCDEGWTGLGCEASILAPECASHRGFPEDVIDDVLIMSALDKNYNKLSNLMNSLESLATTLPTYQSNSCCGGGPDSYNYPIDVSSISTSSYAFLQELMQFSEDSQAFLNEVHI